MFWMIVIWTHMIAAMFWIGGMLFFALVLVPSLREIPSEERTDLVSRIGKRFRRSGWVSLGVLFLTGFLNLYHRGLPLHQSGNALWAKLFLIGVMVSLTLLHDLVLGPKSVRISRSATGPHPLQETARWLARLNLLIGLFIILAAVYLARGY